MTSIRWRSRPLMVLLTTVALVAACAPHPLRTPPVLPTHSCSPGGGRVIGLLGFDDDPVLLPLITHLESYLSTDGFRVERRRRGEMTQLDLAILLDNFHPDVVSDASVRRAGNIYFLATVLAAWMIPVMSSFDQSAVGLDVQVHLIDVRTGNVRWRGQIAARNEEPPSGIPGENDERYVRVRLDRVGSDLAAQVRDEVCTYLAPA